MARLLWSPTWDLAAAQLQRDMVMAALAPFSLSNPGRLQVTSMEIQETPDTLTVTAFFPGVDPKTVEVQATQRSLTFLGQQQTRSPYGSTVSHFQQSLALPGPVKDRHIQVSYQTGGALVVTLPRQTGFWRRLAEIGWAWKGMVPRRISHWLDQLQRQLGYRLRRWSDRLLVKEYSGK